MTENEQHEAVCIYHVMEQRLLEAVKPVVFAYSPQHVEDIKVKKCCHSANNVLTKLSNLQKENTILKEKLWYLWSSKNEVKICNKEKKTSAEEVAKDILDELITKAVFLKEVQSAPSEMEEFSRHPVVLTKRKGKKRMGRTLNFHFKEKQCTGSTKKRKNPHPQKVSLECESVPDEDVKKRCPRIAAIKSSLKLQTTVEEEMKIEPLAELASMQTLLGMADTGEQVDDDLRPFELTIDKLDEKCENTENEKSNCKICNEIFSNADDLFHHLSDMHSDLKGANECKKCLEVYKSHAAYLHHVCRKSSARPLACSMCSATFYKTSRLNVHCKRMHQGKHKATSLHVCQYCPSHAGFLSQLSLLKHHNEKHAAVLKTVACLTCGQFCDGDRDLRNHIQSHDASANFACCFCIMLFKNEEDYKLHQDEYNHAPPNGEC